MPDANYSILVIDRLSDRGVEARKLSFEPNFDPLRPLHRFSVPLLPKPQHPQTVPQTRNVRTDSKCGSISEHNCATNPPLPVKKAQASRYAPVAPM